MSHERLHTSHGLGTLIARVALVCAVLFACLDLTGCSSLEKLDKESDNALDQLSGSGGSSSSSSSSHSTGTSGLSVVERKAMPVRSVKDTRGRQVKIWGQANSTSKTPGHDDTIAAVAVEMASSGDCEYVTMQRSWRTATGRAAASGKIPDIICVRRDGKVDAVEIESKSDNEDALTERLKQGMNTLPSERRGQMRVLKPRL